MPLAFVDWYIVNNKNEVIAKCKYQPDSKDLKTRNEITVCSDIDLPIMEAEYRDGKIVQRIKSQEEINKETTEKEENDENKLIRERMRKIARDQLVKEGKI